MMRYRLIERIVNAGEASGSWDTFHDTIQSAEIAIRKRVAVMGLTPIFRLIPVDGYTVFYPDSKDHRMSFTLIDNEACVS